MPNNSRRGSTKNTRSRARGRRRPRGRKTGAPLWAKLTLTLGALLMMISGAALAGIRTLTGNIEGSIQVAENDDTGDDAAPAGKAFEGAFDVLLLGIDTRASQKATDARSDTILIMHVSANHDQAYLMSVPRDVNIPGSNQRINGAFTNGLGSQGDWRGGLRSAGAAITKLTGITFEASAVIDFSGFKKVIDALGTVPICVEADTKSIHYYMVDGKPADVSSAGSNDKTADAYARSSGNPRYLHRKGCREMAGWEALDYARQRYLPDGSGDYGRQRHQQQLIKAMAKKAGSAGVLSDFGKVNELIAAVGKSMLLSLPKGMGVTDFLFTAKDLASADLVLLKANDGTYASVVQNGEYHGEELTESTKDLFRAAAKDKLANYVLLNPQVVNNEK
ncbi:LCP family protein [Catellatospora bangladeshensis]